MPDRRGSRFILEVLFLVGLAVALALAKLSSLAIAGVMLLGWVIVAVLEWAAWRGEPHYGSGLPPRYYVPSMKLPPAQPLEQVRVAEQGAQRDEAATWIASPALRAEVLGGEALPAEVLGEWPHVVPPPAEQLTGIAPVPSSDEADPWTVVALPAAPLGELEPEPEPAPAVAVELAGPVASSAGVARYSLEPLADPPPRRRFGRGGPKGPPAIEVSARPEGVRALPGRSGAQD